MAVVIVATLFPVPEYRDEVIAAIETVQGKVKSPELAELVAALDGKLAKPMDVQLLTPHPAGSAEKGAL
jgi:hypothetical protein